jgi:enoyl-CoA hydratase
LILSLFPKAMELVLTGNFIDAKEAKELGLVSRVVPAATTIDEAVKLAAQIASLSRPVGMLTTNFL